MEIFTFIYNKMNSIINILDSTYIITNISLLDIFIGILAVKIIIKFFFKGKDKEDGK